MFNKRLVYVTFLKMPNFSIDDL